MKTYPYKISDSCIILISRDIDFRDEFLAYCDKQYGPRNPKGFAKSFAVQNFEDALALFNVRQENYIIIVDNNLQASDIDLFYDRVQDKITNQLKLYYDNANELQLHKNIFNRLNFLVLLTNDPSSVSHLVIPVRTQIIKKPTSIEEIAKIIYPHVFVDAQWERNNITFLPSFKLVNFKIEEIANNADQTSFYVKAIGFSHMQMTKEAGNQNIEIMRFLAEVIEQAVEEQGDAESWIGHWAGFEFVVVINKFHLKSVIQQIQSRFDSGIQAFYLPAQKEQLSLIFYSQYH